MTIETTTSRLGVRCSSTRLARRQKDRRLYSWFSAGKYRRDEHTACKCAQLPYLLPPIYAPTIYKITTLYKSVLLDTGYGMTRTRDILSCNR